MGKLNLSRGDDGRFKRRRKTELHLGNYEQMMKTKAEKTPEILAGIEKLFEDYSGGGVGIVINTYDENGRCDGHKVAIMGIDKPQGLIALAKGLHAASEEAISYVQDSKDPQALLEGLQEMLREILDDKKN